MCLYQQKIKVFLFFSLMFPFSLLSQDFGFLLFQANRPLPVNEKENNILLADRVTEGERQLEGNHSAYPTLSLGQEEQLRAALIKAIDRIAISLVDSGVILQNNFLSKEEIDLLLRYKAKDFASILLKKKIERNDGQKEESQALAEKRVLADEAKEQKEKDEKENSSASEGESLSQAEVIEEKSIVKEEENQAELLAVELSAEEQEQALVLLKRKENQELAAFVDRAGFWGIVKSIQLEMRDSLNQFSQAVVRIALEIHSFDERKEVYLKKELEIVLSGFKLSFDEAFNEAISFLPKQLMREFSGYLVEKGEASVVEILDSNEVVLSLGRQDGVFVGKTFSLLMKNTKKGGALQPAVKGQLKVYKVEENYCYCELLFLNPGEVVLVGDRVEADPFIGLETQVIVGFMGSLLEVSDYKNDGFHLFEGQSQAPSHASFFSENLGYIGIREVVNYGMNLIRPFFGLDFFVDGKKGTGTASSNPEKLWLLGSVEKEGFLYRKDFMGMVRPYVGFNLNWQLNRVTISPEMALGFIFGKRLDFNGESGSPYGVSSGTDYAPIAGSGFHYFTFTSLLNAEVRLDRQFSLLLHAGYDGWLGNMFELKGRIKPELKGATAEDATAITGEDFLKFFDWQFFRIGVGFSVKY